MTQTIIWTIAILTILGAALAVVLYIVAEKFKVEEDPRIDDVEKELPGANCGGCGQAGCRAFAQFCVESEDLDKCFCPVGGNDVMQKVAAVLGREVAAKEPMVAVVRCNGNCENRPKTNEYGGYQSCRVKAALYSGDTGCSFGCLGCGDCVAACQFGAISMDPETGLPVVRVGNSGVSGVIRPDGTANWLSDSSGRPIVDERGVMVETVSVQAMG